MNSRNIRVLVAGWFSFANGHVTAGDILTRDLVCKWLQDAGCRYDLALAAPFVGGVDWRVADPYDYTHAIFVCGPFKYGRLELDFIDRYSSSRLIGVNLSMLTPVEVWQPFDFLFERDSSVRAAPDIAFLTEQKQVPVVGLCLIEPYEDSMADAANAAARLFVESREVAVVQIDTRLDANATGLRSAVEIESLLASMDVVITTRLHGAVLSLKNAVPVIMIDPMGDGAKLLRQAKIIGWPGAVAATQATDRRLQRWFDYCLSLEGRRTAAGCAVRARSLLAHRQAEFTAALTAPSLRSPVRCEWKPARTRAQRIFAFMGRLAPKALRPVLMRFVNRSQESA